VKGALDAGVLTAWDAGEAKTPPSADKRIAWPSIRAMGSSGDQTDDV